MFEHICTTAVDDVSKLNYKASFLIPHNEFYFNVIGLTIVMSNVHNRFMDDYSTSKCNGSVYGFLEPQCIHNSKDKHQQCQHYIETWVKESQRQLYLGAYLNQ